MDYTAIEDSLGRCINHGKVFERFYDEFLASDPAIAECDSHFDSELEKQWRSMLQMTIDYIIAGYDE